MKPWEMMRRFGAVSSGGGGGGSGHRFWRVVITANVSDQRYSSLTEIEFRSSLGGANVATDTSKISSSDRYGPFGEWQLLDGNTDSAWISSGVALPHWIKFDFTNPMSIAELVMAVNDVSRAPRDFTIESSDDDASWSVLQSYSGQTSWSKWVHKSYPT